MHASAASRGEIREGGFSEAIRQFGPRKRHKCGLNVLPSGKTFKLNEAQKQHEQKFRFFQAKPQPSLLSRFFPRSPNGKTGNPAQPAH